MSERTEPARWSPATRIAFRFLFCYFLLYFLPFPFFFGDFLVERYYGVWSVESFERDGREVPLHAEPDRWRSVMFRTPGSLQVEEMTGERKQSPLVLDMEKKTMKLGPPLAGSLTFRRSERDLLLLDGVLEGRGVRAKLRKMPLIRRTT